MNTKSLRFRMISLYAGLLSLALLMFGATVYFGFSRHLNEQMHETLAGQARLIGNEVLVHFAARGPGYVARETEESYEPEANAHYIRVTRADSGLIYLSPGPKDHSFDPAQIPPVPPADRRGYRARIVNAGSGKVVVEGSIYVSPEGEHFLIETGEPYQIIETDLRSIQVAFALGIPVFALVAFIGGSILVRKSLEPIRAITVQAEQISSANISERLPVVHTGDEIERLSLSLNRMIDRLEESINHISRFSADVSHELRTPLTILRGEIESLARTPNDRAESAESIGSSLEEIDRLTRIAEQLLVISRLDAGQASMEHDRVNLGELATQTAEQIRLLADEKSISITFAVQPDVNVTGDALRLRQVVVNLLDNAIKYTGEGGEVQVRVDAELGLGVLAVKDNGIGIPADELPHVFERFYRADKARNRATGGTGLGLSIVKAIASAHKGRVSLISKEGQGTTVTLEIPLEVNVVPVPPEISETAIRSSPRSFLPGTEIA